MPMLTDRAEQPATCAQCWQQITNAATVLCQVTAPLRLQDVEYLETQHPQLHIAEYRVLSTCQHGTACIETEQACHAWVEAWRTAIQGYVCKPTRRYTGKDHNPC